MEKVSDRETKTERERQVKSTHRSYKVYSLAVGRSKLVFPVKAPHHSRCHYMHPNEVAYNQQRKKTFTEASRLG